jgi:hypothetical protein
MARFHYLRTSIQTGLPDFLTKFTKTGGNISNIPALDQMALINFKCPKNIPTFSILTPYKDLSKVVFLV